jgi:uncharacterized protein YbcI
VNEAVLKIPGEARRLMGEFVSTAHRLNYGRGPQTVKVHGTGDLVVVVIEGFMAPLEERLAAQEQNHGLVALIREKMLEVTHDDWASILRERFGLIVQHMEGQVDIKRNRRTITIRVGVAK